MANGLIIVNLLTTNPCISLHISRQMEINTMAEDCCTSTESSRTHVSVEDQRQLQMIS